MPGWVIFKNWYQIVHWRGMGMSFWHILLFSFGNKYFHIEQITRDMKGLMQRR